MNMEDIQVRWRRDNTNNQKKNQKHKIKNKYHFFFGNMYLYTISTSYGWLICSVSQINNESYNDALEEIYHPVS